MVPRAFLFRDFTYRNPQKKKGKELADAVVLFDDVALLVQVKAQCGNHEAKAWATEAVLKAVKQVRATHSCLTSGPIKTLTNEVYGKLDFDPAKYPNMYGIIILAQESDPFDPYEFVPELKESGLPVFVFSLTDIELLTHRFDTAADFIHFIELRLDELQMAVSHPAECESDLGLRHAVLNQFVCKQHLRPHVIERQSYGI
jgi:hypothetical protein